MYGPSEYDFIQGAVRGLFRVLDGAVYNLISAIYQIFFNIATSTLLDGAIIKELFTRIQLILGIFILFKLAISLINGIINPDKMTDKNNGFGKIASRIVVALVLLVAIIPLNIDGVSGSYESQLNNNGILFGTMYEVQNRVLSQGVLENIILGSGSEVDTSNNDSLKTFGDRIAAVVLKSFITVNLKSEDTEKLINSSDDYENADYLMCPDDLDAVKDYRASTNVREILGFTKADYKCTSSNDGEVFTFNYTYFISTAVGILFLIIMVGFTLDITIRAFKLVILRVIAPIPIIGYIDQKSDNGALNTWGRTVLTTYIDLFLRIAIIDFIVFIIESLINTGIALNVSGGPVGIFSWLFILIGLFYFGKQAPKFILDSIGIKSDINIFSGIPKMLAAASIGAAGVTGGISKMRNSVRASQTATDKNNEGNTKNPIGLRKRALKAAGAGAAGLVSGVLGSGMDAARAKDHRYANAMKNRRVANAEMLQDAARGSTWWSRVQNTKDEILTGDNEYQRLARDEFRQKKELEAAQSKLKTYEGKQKLAKGLLSFAEGEAIKSGTMARVSNVNGQTINMATNKWAAALAAGKAQGAKYITVDTTTGTMNLSLAEAEDLDKSVLEAGALNEIVTNQHEAKYQNYFGQLTGAYEVDASKLNASLTNTDDFKSFIKGDVLGKSYGEVAKQTVVVSQKQTALDNTRKEMDKAKANTRERK